MICLLLAKDVREFHSQIKHRPGATRAAKMDRPPLRWIGRLYGDTRPPKTRAALLEKYASVTEHTEYPPNTAEYPGRPATMGSATCSPALSGSHKHPSAAQPPGPRNISTSHNCVTTTFQSCHSITARVVFSCDNAVIWRMSVNCRRHGIVANGQVASRG